MNERIRELWEEATVSTWPRSGKFTAGEYDYHLKKFAELIVRECGRVFESEVDTWKQMDPYQGSIKRQGTKAIREHFGVEE